MPSKNVWFLLCSILVAGVGCQTTSNLPTVDHRSFCEDNPRHEICITDDDDDDGDIIINNPPPALPPADDDDDDSPAFDGLVLIVNGVRVENGDNSPEVRPGAVVTILAPGFNCVCTIEFLDWMGRRIGGTDGSLHWTVPTTPGRYRIRCVITNEDGSTDEIVIFIIVVVVNPPPSPPPPTFPVPTVNLTVNKLDVPIVVPFGSSVRLEWTSADATLCVASGTNWFGARLVVGSEVTPPLSTGQHVYTLTWTGPGGSVSDTVVINVSNQEPPPPNECPLGAWSVEILTPANNAVLAVADGNESHVGQKVPLSGRVIGIDESEIALVWWDLPDLGEVFGLVTEYEFNWPGEGDIQLKVRDTCGLEKEFSIHITILEQP